MFAAALSQLNFVTRCGWVFIRTALAWTPLANAHATAEIAGMPKGTFASRDGGGERVPLELRHA